MVRFEHPLLSLKWIAAAASSVLFVLLVFTSPLIENVSALGGSSPLRPEWIRAGDYVTYLYSKTALGISETIHIRDTVQDDRGVYLNRLRVERYGEQTSPNFPSRLSHLSPSVEEGVTDPYLITSEDQVSSEKPEIEQVRGLNNKTYEAYKFVYPVLYVLGEPCQCNMTVWFEKETLVRVKQLQWWAEDGVDVKAEQIIEDSNIPQLAAPVEPATPGKQVVTSTTTVYVKAPQTMITTTVATTTTITATAITTIFTTTSTLTEEITSPSTYAWATGATVATVVLAAVVVLLLRRAR